MEGVADEIFKGIRDLFILGGVVAALGVGATYYFTNKSNDNEIIERQMTWIADHNIFYGNKNGKLDLQEKLGIMKDLRTSYSADESISIDDAKKYLELYNNSTIQLDTRNEISIDKQL